VVNYYEILGVEPGADQTSIKRAYRKKALQLHPDHNTSPKAEEEFIELTVAYEFLTAKNKTTAFYAPAFEEKRASSAAREFARMRYEKFVRRNSAFERLSIHKIFWGRSVTYIILVIFLVFMADLFAPVKKSMLDMMLYREKIQDNANSLVISGAGFRFRIGDMEVFRSSRQILVEHTPLLGVVTGYRLEQDNFEEKYLPSVSIMEYSFLPPVVVLSCILILFTKVKTFEKKLLLKFIVLISTLCFLLVFIIARF
jgi:hypothetical protein